MDQSKREYPVSRNFNIILSLSIFCGIILYGGYPNFPDRVKVVLESMVGHPDAHDAPGLVFFITAIFYLNLVYHILYFYFILDSRRPLKLFLINFFSQFIWDRIKGEKIKESLIRIESGFPTLFGVCYFIISFSICMLALKGALLFLPLSAHSGLNAVVWLTHIDMVGVSLAILGCLLAVAITIIVELKKDEDTEKLNTLIKDMNGAIAELKEVHGNFKPLNSFEERLDYLINFIKEVKKNHPYNEIILANYNLGYGALQSYHLNSIRRLLTENQNLTHANLESKFYNLKQNVETLFHLIEESNAEKQIESLEGSLFNRLKIITLRSDSDYANPSAYSNWLFNFLKGKNLKFFGKGTDRIDEDLSKPEHQDSFVIFKDKDYDGYQLAKKDGHQKEIAFINAQKNKFMKVAFDWNMKIKKRLLTRWKQECLNNFHEVSYLPMPFFVTFPKEEAIKDLISENRELYYRSLVVFTDVNDHPQLDKQFNGFVSNKSDVALNLRSLYDGLLKDSATYDSNRDFIQRIFFGGAEKQSVVIKAIEEDNIKNREQARLSYLDDLKCYSLVKDLCSDFGVFPQETYDKDLVGNCAAIPPGNPLNLEEGYFSIGLFGNLFLECLIEKNDVPFKLTREEKIQKDSNGKEIITFYDQKIYFDESYSEKLTDPNIDYAIFAHYDLCYPVTILGGLTSKSTGLFGAYLKRNFPQLVEDFGKGEYDTLIYEVNLSKKSVVLKRAFHAMTSWKKSKPNLVPLGGVIESIKDKGLVSPPPMLKELKNKGQKENGKSEKKAKGK